MKLEKWALLAEVISGLAILVTLIILVVDVRSNSRLLGRQQYMERVDRLYYLDNPEIADIAQKISTVESSGVSPHHREFMNRFGLDASEAQAWSSFAWRTWQMHQADFLYENTDRLDVDIRNMLSNPGLALYLDIASGNFEPEFLDHVNELRSGE